VAVIDLFRFLVAKLTLCGRFYVVNDEANCLSGCFQ